MGRAAFAQRLAGWQQKALREAKLKSDWADPNAAYEKAAQDLLHRLIVDEAAPALRAEIFAFIQEIAPAGAVNGLAQTLLRMTAPACPISTKAPSSGISAWSIPTIAGRSTSCCARRCSAQTTLATWRDGAIKQSADRAGAGPCAARCLTCSRGQLRAGRGRGAARRPHRSLRAAARDRRDPGGGAASAGRLDPGRGRSGSRAYRTPACPLPTS